VEMIPYEIEGTEWTVACALNRVYHLSSSGSVQSQTSVCFQFGRAVFVCF
jgi:hypothetical protein